MSDDYELSLDNAIRAAERDGISPFVIAVLSDDSVKACSIFNQIGDIPVHASMVRVHGGNDVVVTWSVDLACQFLRQHCGIGGRLIANVIERQRAVAHWLMLAQKQMLTLSGWNEERILTKTSTYMFKLFGDVCDSQKNLEGPFCISASLKGGRKIAIEGNDVLETLYVATLISIASTRRLPPLGLDSGERGLVIVEANLAMILLEHFASRPVAVARALCALQGADGPGFRWLMSTLDAFPALNTLAAELPRPNP